jgi:tetratricopeptide (TPR) repeat protein
VELDPQDPDGYVSRARVKHDLLDDIAGALADVERGIELGTSSSVAFGLRASARLNAKDLSGALADIERWIELAPRDASAYAARAKVRMRLPDAEPEVLLEDLDRALELDPTSTDALKLRAEAHGLAGDVRGVVDDLNRAVEIDPEDPFARATRGTFRMDHLGDMAGAVHDLEEALRLEPALAPRIEEALAKARAAVEAR